MSAGGKFLGTWGLLSACLVAGPLSAATGIVFDDVNGNGVRDPGEPGLPAVEVSNGVDVAVTDASGRYRVADRPGAFVFVVKPRGWASPVDANGPSRFYAAPGGSADFPLHRAEEPDALKALVLTDPQPSTQAEVGFLSRGLFERLGRRTDLQFGVTLGDVVYDRQDLFGEVNAVVAKAGIPWHVLPGNHDLSLGTPDEGSAVAAFERAYGPSTYAFHAGPALFFALDDVRPLGGPRYVGGLREDQFAFVGNVLRGARPDEWVVLMMHIPSSRPTLRARRPSETRTGSGCSGYWGGGAGRSSSPGTPITSATCSTAGTTDGRARSRFTSTTPLRPRAVSGEAPRTRRVSRPPRCGTGPRPVTRCSA